jgi:hypothetical protein
MHADCYLAPQQVTGLYVTGNGTVRNRSLAGYYNTCSYGQVTLPASNVKVLGPVEIPCSGTLNATNFGTGPKFTTSACDENDNMPKWQYWLSAWAKAKFNVNSADYHHSIIYLPPNFASLVKGWSSVACKRKTFGH